MPLWQVDRFELKIIKTQETQEEVFASPSNALNNSGRGFGTGKRAIFKDNFFFNFFKTKHLFFLSSCEFPSSSLKTQVPTPLFGSRQHISLSHSPLSLMSLGLTYTQHLFLFFSLQISYVNLIIRPVNVVGRKRKDFCSYILIKKKLFLS